MDPVPGGTSLAVRPALVPADPAAYYPGAHPLPGGQMPRFMDYHDDLKLPTEAIDQITSDTKAGTADQFGVRQIELYHNPDGKVYCLLEAPDADAVRHH